MKKAMKKRVALNRETLRQLTEGSLPQVVAGITLTTVCYQTTCVYCHG
jgi:hypothetical protein